MVLLRAYKVITDTSIGLSYHPFSHPRSPCIPLSPIWACWSCPVLPCLLSVTNSFIYILCALSVVQYCSTDSYLTFIIVSNNAGVMATPFILSKDNMELQFATNHLGKLEPQLWHMSFFDWEISLGSLSSTYATLNDSFKLSVLLLFSSGRRSITLSWLCFILLSFLLLMSIIYLSEK